MNWKHVTLLITVIVSITVCYIFNPDKFCNDCNSYLLLLTYIITGLSVFCLICKNLKHHKKTTWSEKEKMELEFKQKMEWETEQFKLYKDRVEFNKEQLAFEQKSQYEKMVFEQMITLAKELSKKVEDNDDVKKLREDVDNLISKKDLLVEISQTIIDKKQSKK